MGTRNKCKQTNRELQNKCKIRQVGVKVMWYRNAEYNKSNGINVVCVWNQSSMHNQEQKGSVKCVYSVQQWGWEGDKAVVTNWGGCTQKGCVLEMGLLALNTTTNNGHSTHRIK